MSFTYRSGHLGDAVDLYVDGALDAESSRRAARHLLICARCRGEADARRAIVREIRQVRLDPARHATLVADLLALAPGHGGEAVRPQPDLMLHPRARNLDAMGIRARHRAAGIPGPRAVRLAAGAALSVGAAAALAFTFTTGARTHPVAPRLAHHAPAEPERAVPVRLALAPQASTSGAVMRANGGPSGRMRP